MTTSVLFDCRGGVSGCFACLPRDDDRDLALGVLLRVVGVCGRLLFDFVVLLRLVDRDLDRDRDLDFEDFF